MIHNMKWDVTIEHLSGNGGDVRKFKDAFVDSFTKHLIIITNDATNKQATLEINNIFDVEFLSICIRFYGYERVDVGIYKMLKCYLSVSEEKTE